MDLEEIVRKYLDLVRENGGSVSYTPEIKEIPETGEWAGCAWANIKLEPGRSASSIMFPVAIEMRFRTKDEAARYVLMESVGKSLEEAILEMEAFGV